MSSQHPLCYFTKDTSSCSQPTKSGLQTSYADSPTLTCPIGRQLGSTGPGQRVGESPLALSVYQVFSVTSITTVPRVCFLLPLVICRTIPLSTSCIPFLPQPVAAHPCFPPMSQEAFKLTNYNKACDD